MLEDTIPDVEEEPAALAADVGKRKQRASGLRRRRDRAMNQPLVPTLQSVARIAGELGHELNNQLAAVLNYSYVLGRRLQRDDQASEHVSELQAAAWDASALAEQLLTFSHARRVPSIGTDVAGILRELEPLLLHGLDPDRELMIVVDDELHPVSVPRGPIESLLLRAALIKHRCGLDLGPLVIGADNVRIGVRAPDGTPRMADFVQLGVGPLPYETAGRRPPTEPTGETPTPTAGQLLSDRVRTGLTELGASIEATRHGDALHVRALLPRVD